MGSEMSGLSPSPSPCRRNPGILRRAAPSSTGTANAATTSTTPTLSTVPGSSYGASIRADTTSMRSGPSRSARVIPAGRGDSWSGSRPGGLRMSRGRGQTDDDSQFRLHHPNWTGQTRPARPIDRFPPVRRPESSRDHTPVRSLRLRQRRIMIRNRVTEADRDDRPLPLLRPSGIGRRIFLGMDLLADRGLRHLHGGRGPMRGDGASTSVARRREDGREEGNSFQERLPRDGPTRRAHRTSRDRRDNGQRVHGPTPFISMSSRTAHEHLR